MQRRPQYTNNYRVHGLVKNPSVSNNISLTAEKKIHMIRLTQDVES